MERKRDTEEEEEGELCLLASELSLSWRVGNKRVQAEGFTPQERL